MLDPAGERRSHLAAGADDQHVALETAGQCDVGVRRVCERSLELGFGVDAGGQLHRGNPSSIIAEGHINVGSRDNSQFPTVHTPKTSAAVVLLMACVLVAAGIAGGTAPASADGPRFHIRIAAADAAAVEATLERHGYDVLGTDHETSTVDVAVSLAEWRTLAAAGYRGGVVAAARPLRDILRPRRGRLVRASGGSTAAASTDLVPANYRDLEGIIGRMHEIAAAHPAIAQVVDITAVHEMPPTYEGRHLFALKISDNVAADEDEPAVLIVGTHHAREIVAPVITLGAAERLTSGYGTDARIRSAVNGHEIWIAPVWNPDGYNYVFTTDNMWRKNRRRRCRRRRRRSEPKLSARMERWLHGQHERRVGDVQRSRGRVGSRDADHDDVVAARAIRQGHRLSLQRP